MVKQIRDYVLEARQIRESKERKNENLSVKEMIDEFDYGNIELRDLDNGQVEDLYYQMTKEPMTRSKIRTNLNDAKSMREEIKKYLLKHHGIKTESLQKNEADYSKDWELYRNGAKGSFMQHLAQAFQQADMKNAKKLYDAFPEVGKLFMLWKTNGQKDRI